MLTQFKLHSLDKIFNALERISNVIKPLFTYEELAKSLSDTGLTHVYRIIEILFDYSLIGNQDPIENVNFKYRDKGFSICKLDKNQNFIPHYILKVYFKRN